MTAFASISDFREFLATLPGRIAAAKEVGLRAASGLVLNEIRSEIGTYQTGDAGFEDMAPLSIATLEGFGPLPGKIADGHAPPDNPLLAGGAVRDSFGSIVEGDEAAIGSNDPVAVYQNQGTERRGIPYIKGATTEPGIPAREFIGRAAFRKEPEAIEIISTSIQKAFIG
jgi:hypothetical protein